MICGEILKIDKNASEIEKIIRNIRMLPAPRGNRGGNKARYKNCICAFDIETSTIETGRGPDGPLLDSFMYIWQFQIDDHTIIGRTWEDFLQLLEIMKKYTDENDKYIVFVHNLSYEFVFLSGIYHFSPEEVFAMDARKILKCEMMGCFEFRCSYLHSNMSLKEYCKKWKVEDQKLSGDDFDYKKVRYPWTELTEEELHYCVNDVRGLVEAIRNEMKFDGDDLYHFPLTSTGYVRRDVKKAMKTYNWDSLKRQLPDFEIFKLLQEAFRGGNTHANRWFANQIVETDEITRIQSFDRSSSYPDCICNDQFPTGRWYIEPEINNTMDRLIYLMKVRHKAILARVHFTNIRLRDPDWGCPYLSTNKCWNIVKALDQKLSDKYRKPIYTDTFDNGRVCAALSLCTTVTDVDLRIILDEYEFDDVEILTLAHSTYGKLPDQLTSCVRDYYTKKTSLKGVEGQENLYNKSKAKLNAIYGMMVQNPIKPKILFIDGDEEEPYQTDYSKSYMQLLEEANGKAFLSYAWGVWVTAWARYRLEEGIKIVHRPDLGSFFLYADTDSVKFFCAADALDEITRSWKEYNEKRKAASLRSGAFATDPKGVTHYMGVYELDAVYTDFKTLGAKKYAYHDAADGDLHITIAGVNKAKGGIELERAGGLEAFREGVLFVFAGGTDALYNDVPHVDHIDIDGHYLPITRNVVIRDSTYRLGITAEYARILEYPEIYRKIFDGIKLQKDLQHDIVLPY